MSLRSAELNRSLNKISIPVEAKQIDSTDQTPEPPPSTATSSETIATDSALVVYLPPAVTIQNSYNEHHETRYYTHLWLIARAEPLPIINLHNHQLALSEHFNFATSFSKKTIKPLHHPTRTLSPQEAIQLSKQLDKQIKELKQQSEYGVPDIALAMPAIDTTAQLLSQLDSVRRTIAFPKKRTGNRKTGNSLQNLKAIYQSIRTAMETLLIRTGDMTTDQLLETMTINGEQTTFIDFIADCYSALPAILSTEGLRSTQFMSIRYDTNQALIDTVLSIHYDQGSDKLPEKIYHLVARLFSITINNQWNFEDDERIYDMFSIAGLAFIDNNDVELMLLLARHLSETYFTDTYSEAENNGSDKTALTHDLFLIIWSKLLELMPNQDIPVGQLLQFEQQAKRINIDTVGWSDFIHQYKKLKQQTKEDFAKKRANSLLQELEKEYQERQAVLSKARQGRSLMSSKGITHSRPMQAVDNTSDAPEPSPASNTPEPEQQEPWEILYQQGARKLAGSQFANARSLFQEALSANPSLLGEAIIYSAIADTYFVPGEEQLKQIRQSFGQIQLVRDTMRHAIHQPVDKKRLNTLSEQFISQAKTLDEPIKHSAEYHLKSIQRLSFIPASQRESLLAKSQAEELLAILKQEGTQLEQIKHLISEGVDALLETYTLRRDFILDMPSAEPKKAADNEPPSREAQFKQSLESLKHQLNPGQQKETSSLSAKSNSSRKQRVDLRKPHTLYNTFEEALKAAHNMERHWNLGAEPVSEEAHYHSLRVIREIVSQFYKENRQLTFKKLGNKLKRSMIRPSNIQSLLEQLNGLSLASHPAQPISYSRLNEFLSPRNRAIVDVEADHLCLFNAIALWLNEHRDATSAFANINSGQELFLALAPFAMQLAAMHPDNIDLNAIAAAFHVNRPNVQLWGTTDMLHTLIAPILQVPVMVFDNAAIAAGSPIIATLVDPSGSQHHVQQQDIFNVMTRDTMILVHDTNHWMTVLPVPAYQDPASQLDHLPTPADSLTGQTGRLNY
ncbi:hypothetical protein GZ77_14575 [Endozoicomonas montiporae]|uniref:OTU domain-containing protein n=2 Tax=Endozoicomonas montiporae TaxID=1027273 RepID=A0A081N526_9GAMM|nr:hypothetical protein [Endozoicomonas montiporae]AMO57574.1 hypothetical protein EZMO1_3594 [Endozoicomonas montiporae CL-33]KEQ13549.1 hypothetical protein GZ77_14575 [Endozoicomonas montiporae]